MGHPRGPCGAVSATVSPPGTVSTGFAKGEVSPGDSWAWVLDGAFREQMGASQEPYWAGGPGTHPAFRRAAWWEDLISV